MGAPVLGDRAPDRVDTIERMERLLPGSASSTCALTAATTIVVSLLIVGVVGPAVGLSTKYGGRGHDGYLEIAATLVEHGRFALDAEGPRLLHRPPAMSFFLACVHALLGPSRFALCVAQGLLAGVLAAVTFAHARSQFGLRIARLTTAGLLLYPWLHWHVKNPMTPILVATLASLVVFTSHLADRDDRIHLWALTGFFGGLLALTHGATLLFAPLAIGLVLIRRGNRGRRIRPAHPAVAIAVFVLTIAPWTHRNHELTGRFIPVATNAGYAYFWGLIDLDSLFESREGVLEEQIFARAGIDRSPAGLVVAHGIVDPTLEDSFTSAMIRHAASHPCELATKVLVHGTWFWFPLRFSAENLLLWLTHGVFLTFVVRGAVRAYIAGTFPYLSVAYVAYVWPLHAIFVATAGHAQYSFASFVLLLPTAVIGATGDVVRNSSDD